MTNPIEAKQAKHIPLPSAEDIAFYLPVLLESGSENGNGIVKSKIVANAAFIVKAVNSHEKLVEACKLAKSRITLNIDMDDVYEILKAALKSAGEEI